MNFTITKAANGYIVACRNPRDQGGFGQQQQHVARNEEDLLVLIKRLLKIKSSGRDRNAINV